MISRRFFLKSGAVAAAGLWLGMAMPGFLARAVAASEKARSRPRTLVVIFLRGAADGLSMVPPVGDPGYYRARPTLAVRPPRAGDPDAALELDGFFGLHPSLAPLHGHFRAGRLAIVHATGSPDPTRSHFDAQDFMELGTPGQKRPREGWLNRAMQVARDPTPGSAVSDAPPLRAVAVGDAEPMMLRGSSPILTLPSRGAVAGHGRDSGLREAFHEMYGSSTDGMITPSIKAGLEGSRLVERIQAPPYTPAGGARYPEGPLALGSSLRQVAQLIKADVGLEVAFTDMGGWDHHTGGGKVMPIRLTELGQALDAFSRDLGDRMEDVVVLTLTEFGRMVEENGYAGTDHGHGSCMLVLGGPVRGGKVYGRWPGLEPEHRFEGRDLAVTTDYRTVCAAVLSGHFGISEPGQVFPGFVPPREERLELIG